MSGFAGKIQRFLADNVPAYLQGPNAQAFLQGTGLTLDAATQTLITGLRQSSPFAAFVYNLPFIGADRGIKRYPTETEQGYRLRLARWRQIRHFAGTHYGQMINLQPYFYPAVPRIRIFHQAGDGLSSTCHTLYPDGTYTVTRSIPSVYNYDGVDAKWSRFHVAVDGSVLTKDPAHYDDGTLYDDGTVWDGYLSASARDDIVGIINDSKAAHSVLWTVMLCDNTTDLDPAVAVTTDADGRTSMPVANWGSAIDPDTGLPSRLLSAHFIYDMGQG